MGFVVPFDQFVSTEPNEVPSVSSYQAADLQKMQWISGDWVSKRKGEDLRVLCMFHSPERLEIMDISQRKSEMAHGFVWRDGRYYFGDAQQWVVTWIGAKDIRFDAVQPDVDAMTWTRQNAQKWHCIYHKSTGDQAVLFERPQDLQP